MAKKKVVTTKDKAPQGQTKGKKVLKKTDSSGKKVLKATVPKRTTTTSSTSQLLFNSENYKWMAIGAGLILLGMVCMIGGKMPDPNTWDPDIIYSKRITVLGPILILSGLAVEIYAIFKK